ncbi:MAG: hypothetical protein HGB22_09695, partial [Chlorobiaceae bacterium]|nr:hypothetical protein [Chlorobiaceae bacterium]
KAGSYQQTIGSVTGNDAANYSFASFTTSASNYTVSQKALTASATAVNKVYDGTPDTSIILSDNRVTGDLVSIDGTSASFDDKNAGTAKTVTVSGMTLVGTDAANYTWNTMATTTADITPASLDVTAIDSSKTFNGLAYSGGNGVSYIGFVNGETSNVLNGTVSYGGTSQGAVDVGNYTIIPGGLSSGNYAITFHDGLLTIDPPPPLLPVDTIYANGNQPGTVNSPTPPASVVTVDTNGLVNVPGLDTGGFAGESTGSAGSIAETGGETSPSLLEQSGVTGNISMASMTYDNGTEHNELNGLTVTLVIESTGNGSGLIQVSVPPDMLRPGVATSFTLPEEVKSVLIIYGGVENATLEGGGLLPSWLSYDSGSKSFTIIDAPDGGLPVKALVTLGNMSWVVDISVQGM